MQGRIPTRTWAFEELEDCQEGKGQAKEARVEDILRPERRWLITSDTTVTCRAVEHDARKIRLGMSLT